MFAASLLPFALLAQQATTPSDLPPAPPPERAETDPEKMRKIYVTDSQVAARTKVDHPLQPVCVRRLKPGSRVKAQTVCQDVAAWKAYVLAQDANFYEWDTAQRGLDVK
ncbi:hypothetical protein [Erythrobacter litoralis]|uniref:Uncharacterized protein n=1 Tax=Erythrobacter litoralis (strain HTCC2594) TaxID=314225 RepID=Q2NDN1_ERYLH|nr:hypothetical protein [Erythrobacter litoralis]ABC62210.1 hypothetical protein ELI_00590 [Erythrobacter litoralis HTCC2594]